MTYDTYKPSQVQVNAGLIEGQKEMEARASISNARIANSNLIQTSISPLYQRYIGKTVTIAFNGNFMKLPVDGSSFSLSQGHYNALQKYLRHIDKQIKISNNNAQFMGTTARGDFRQV